MDEPGFCDQDVKMIEKYYKQVEAKLDKVTQRIGVNWIITYLPPEKGAQETPSLAGPKDVPPEAAAAKFSGGRGPANFKWWNSLAGYKARSGENWGQYRRFARRTAGDKLKS